MHGKLGTFIRAVEIGVVPSDAILLVESLDRISRNDVDEALVLFLSIIRLGVTVITLADGQTYCTETIKRDHGMSLIVSIVIMMRANEESAMRGRRVQANWEAAAAKGGTFTKIYPCWLSRRGDQWTVDEAKAEIVRGIFQWYLEGFGAPTIARWLNDLGIEPISGRAKYWTQSVIWSLLNNRTVYGELHRRAHLLSIPDYYPAIVSKKTFESAASISDARHWSQQHFDACYMFESLGSCGECGARMRKISGWSCNYRIQCRSAFYRAGCPAPTLSGRAADIALVKELAFGKVLGTLLDDSGMVAAREQLERIARDLQTMHFDRERLLELALSGDSVSSIASKVARIEKRMAKLEVERDGIRKAVSPSLVADLANARRLSNLMTTDGLLIRDMLPWQTELSSILRRILESVTFDTVRHRMTLTFVGGVRSEVEIARLSGGRPGNEFWRLRSTNGRSRDVAAGSHGR